MKIEGIVGSYCGDPGADVQLRMLRPRWAIRGQ